MNTMTLTAAACGGLLKCAAHAIPAMAAAFAAGYVLGRIRGRNAGKPAKARQKQQRDQRARDEKTRVPVPAGSVEIYAGNLSYEMTEEQLRKTFEKFGKVDSARIVANRFNGKSKGFAFIVMPDRKEAEAAIAAINGKEVLGRAMRVNEAKNTVVKEA